jgi:hypothetical protein
MLVLVGVCPGFWIASEVDYVDISNNNINDAEGRTLEIAILSLK